MLECNRLNSQASYRDISEEDDVYKNKWTNNVNSYGIVVEPGDTITLDSASINTLGTTQDGIEFLGNSNLTNDEDFADNKVRLGLGYYITDTRQYTLKLPLINMKTYTNYGVIETNDPPPDQATKFDNPNFVLNRALGDVDLSDYPRSGTTPVINPVNMPQKYIPNFAILTAGAGFEIGTEYSTSIIQPVKPTPPHTGSGLKIICEDTLSVAGGVQGALSKFRVSDWGDYTYNASFDLNVELTTPPSGFKSASIILQSPRTLI
jgi:hypothetical protein